MNRRTFLDVLLGLVIGFKLPQTKLPKPKFYLLSNIVELSLSYNKECYNMDEINYTGSICKDFTLSPKSGYVTVCIRKEERIYDIRDIIKIPGVENLFEIYSPGWQDWQKNSKLVTYAFKPIEGIK